MRTIALLLFLTCSLRGQELLPGAQPLTATGDLSAQMVAGIDRFLMQETKDSIAKRDQPDRERFRKIIGAVDAREKVEAPEFISTTAQSAKVGEHKLFEVFAVRWPVFEGVHGEGLLLQPKKPIAGVIALP